LYGVVWWIFKKSAVTFAPQPAGLPNARMLCIVHLGKIAVPGTKSQIADRKIVDKLYGKSYENFQSSGFPHNWTTTRGSDGIVELPAIQILVSDFAIGTGTWYWYSMRAPYPYINILVYTDFISGYLSDIWRKNIGYFQP
jgi:hypothetical protein